MQTTTPTASAQHILFVDDEAPIRELLSLFFRKKGLQVTTAINGAQAKELSSARAYDLVILDLQLADENGFDLLSYFKGKYPGMPVVIFTGLGCDEQLMAKARAGGADGFMSKSESLGHLFNQVAPLLTPAKP